MKKFWGFIGVAIFWAGWPFQRLVINRTKRVRVLIASEGQLLLVKNWISHGRWTLPGGGIHKHEMPENAVAREIKEELGLELSAGKLRPLFHEVMMHDSGIVFDCACFAVATGQKPKLILRRGEIHDARWFTLKAARQQHLSPAASQALSVWADKTSLLH